MIIELQKFDLKPEYIPGSKMFLADTLSRNLTSNPDDEQYKFQNVLQMSELDLELEECNQMNDLSVTKETQGDIIQAT